MKVAATQFSLEPIANAEIFWQRVENLISQAKVSGATAILFPEYFSLALLTAKPYSGSFQQRLQAFAQDPISFCQKIHTFAKKYKIWVLAGTIPVKVGKKIYNRAFIVPPKGKIISQDKIMMTRFEAEEWKISGAAKKLRTFKIGAAKCALLTCYDIEFPALSRLAAKAKVDIIFVPSCTDDRHGYWRVRHCAQARAVENQTYIISAAIVGGHPQYPEINSHSGRGAIYTPCDIGFPERGILTEGDMDQEGLCLAELDLKLLQKIRKNGTVLNLRDQR